MEPGTARKPAARHWFSPQPSNLDGTLSHQLDPPLPPEISYMSFRRNDSSTAFLAHWFTCQSVPALFGHPQRAGVQRRQRRLDGVAGLALGGGGDAVAGLPGGFDGGFKGGVGHGRFPFRLVTAALTL